MDSAGAMEKICGLVLRDTNAAREALRQHLPLPAVSERQGRKYTERQKMRVFVRDRFVDRYDGSRLVFPAVLRLVSKLFPVEFPYQKNWKIGECHDAYWHLSPTIDHVDPVARGGADVIDNWVTTSMRNNSIKSHWTLEELRWSLVDPAQKWHGWDGLVGWFMEFEQAEPAVVQNDKYLRTWHRAAAHVRKA